MKQKIHPKYNHKAEVSCACGNTFVTGSTLDKIELDICSACHPFFTGEMRLIDTQGRIEKFTARRQKADQYAKTSKKKRKEKSQKQRPTSLKEMLTQETKKSARSDSKQ